MALLSCEIVLCCFNDSVYTYCTCTHMHMVGWLHSLVRALSACMLICIKCSTYAYALYLDKWYSIRFIFSGILVERPNGSIVNLVVCVNVCVCGYALLLFFSLLLTPFIYNYVYVVLMCPEYRWKIFECHFLYNLWKKQSSLSSSFDFY